ncbi:MAG: hypothetical protein WBO57_08445 [Gammaproteobacteria bacterium]
MNALQSREPAGIAAAAALCECIRLLASRNTNPVLELLESAGHFVEHQKLPAEMLRFGGNDWRAYYHCHGASHRTANEHGHFHIFARVPQALPDTLENWAHVISLAMDVEGQPVRWFAVNRWVTDSVWLEADRLAALLDRLQPVPGFGLVERWLVAMLETYHDEIVSLLRSRDRRVQALAAAGGRVDVLEDRRFACLAEQPVDLLTRLQQVFAGKAAPAVS